MNDRNFQPANDNGESKSKAKVFWKHVGLIALALGLAVLTVFVINLNR